ncbi:peptidase domain-containing ABC transporter [Calothrix sp. FACHB-1219]|uniref:peptidase domain-containing ABC transporter n=1 Tax=unclassified Calothrix TaxID=2619626 RepID=UPI001686D2CE|nr:MULTISPECIES: peptidase domain-containing ABC transporter [unclassified Calothrix]MBD2204969.1 peptidase domain-containing ABC transporter [Calothrix sp. FACHB-168]MBD2216207.1 peptidase domain-containing ABC transporter [Calothrix sp. FACHB-1219]
MKYIQSPFQDFLITIEGFNQLPSEVLVNLASKLKPQLYSLGHKIIDQKSIPQQLSIIYQGTVRLLAYEPKTQMPIPLKLLQPGEILGEISLLREVACELAIASTEVQCLQLDAHDYLSLLASYPEFAQFRQYQANMAELYHILTTQSNLAAIDDINFKQLARQVLAHVKIDYLPPGTTAVNQLDQERIWFVSGGGTVKNFDRGSPLEFYRQTDTIEVEGTNPARLLGVRKSDLLANNPHADITNKVEIPYAPIEELAKPQRPIVKAEEKSTNKKYPYFKGKGQLNSAIACFQMLCQYLHMPFRREVINRILTEQMQRQGIIPFQVCATLAELIGLKAQLGDMPCEQISRIPTPAMIHYGDSYGVVYEASDRLIVIAVPSKGILKLNPAELLAQLQTEDSDRKIRVLLLSPTKITPQKRFGLQWFLPYISRYRYVLLEVFIASLFVQLAALANPLIIQIIIDQIVSNTGFETLHILGIFLLVAALFEAVISTLRTYLFVDTTNRIDLGLGAKIIDHLLRLPLQYFERRPVGELATRINELENIRSFLTGTVLTVGLDSLFSVIYIIVMAIYSWKLTLVGLSTIPIFIIITTLAAPTIRKQLREKAELNAVAQSYLVEVMSGMQTVKAQNIELQARFSWQERYARYIASGFKKVVTSTFSSSTSHFLNKLSSLLILWYGAYLVLQGELTLGELIAFRILSNYVTSPILRLTQLWQNFQETALSLERLSDIVDTPQEAEKDSGKMTLPPIKGAVKYENVFFRFNARRALQLCNVSVDLAPGQFIGIVGQSGSGKSTMMKLLLRLYEPESGRILIDGYDIAKVELYSLRGQIGVVPQDTLLFDGTVQENIALTNPEASTEEIITAAKIAAAHEFIMNLPNGYNTKVGERGSALSGGQRQRIAIARSVLEKPKLLVLDEATSALDYLTERQVCLNLAQAFQGSTVFCITHRLNTISHADTIIVMDSGKVIEQGKHEELMALKGYYYNLYNQQEL